MALTDDSNIVMPVSPMGGNGFGNGFGGDNGWWIILLLLFAGGWGNGFGGGFGGFGGGELYPWMNQADITTSGFQNLATQNQISAISSGIGDIQTQLCGGFAGVTAAITNGFAQNEIANNARQIADMNQNFAAQTATLQGFNGLQSQLAQCCCDNRLAVAQTQALVQSENCADRAALSDGIRDIITNQTAGVQRILDVMCQDKIDAKNERIADLERQLTMANLAASQTAQTSRLLADNAAQTVALEQYLNPVPVPAYIVQNPNTYGCGCGCGNF